MAGLQQQGRGEAQSNDFGPLVDKVLVQVAHVDLTLWRDYSSTVEAEAKATSESEEQETRKIEKEL